ncbi:MAG: ribonuclease E/G [Pseudomonadota bacterium]
MAGNNKMLIDATHPEETRVAVVKGNRVEEFDFESQDKHQIRGNIYLAKVTRVEPSLQAAFIEYGGNRHGFLAFSEIHPDYYQIPLADREALLEEEREEQAAEQAEDDAAAEKPRRRRRSRNKAEDSGADNESVSEEAATSDDDADADSKPREDGSTETVAEAADTSENDADSASNEDESDDGSDEEADDDSDGDSDGDDVDSVGSDDAMEEVPARRKPRRRSYKIQEVIKRRQILLVQVVKEERGNKGAAMTTYLSLAGRYCVLMPNTPRGGGISRKITNASDRKRLKSIAGDLEVPQGMGVIVRTAGASRSRGEINRDFQYLSRLWENVRTLTLKSSAPCLVYEEGSLIKRSIRDLFNKDIGDVLVSGEDGYREAKEFMRMLMPSHAASVKPHREATPLFARYGIEGQLDGMMQPQVTLKSGGYLVINQTEALVAVDVNSGRSTRESSIEDTALKTNLEAAEEMARQLRLRDLAGLVVIDFIDMDERRNNRAVEKKLKDCLKHDRARIQVGRISHFGLLEMSRQRLRASVLDSTTVPCPHCGGTGLLRADSVLALQILRAVEEAMIKAHRNDIVARVHADMALFLLNNKRDSISELEARYGLLLTVTADPTLTAQTFQIEKGEPVTARERPEATGTVQPDSIRLQDAEDAKIDAKLAEQAKADAADDEDEVVTSSEGDDGDENGEREDGRKRRRRRRGGKRNNAENSSEEANADDSDGDDNASGETGDDEDGDKPKRRRRGRRGGRRHRKDETVAADGENAEAVDGDDNADAAAAEAVEGSEPAATSEDTVENAPKPRRTTRRRKVKTEDAAAQEAEQKEAGQKEAGQEQAAKEDPAPADASEEEVKPKPRRKRRTKAQIEADKAAEAEAKEKAAAEKETALEAQPEPEKPAKPARRTTRRKKADHEAVDAAAVAASSAVAVQAETPGPAANQDAAAPETKAEPEAKAEEDTKKPRKGGWWQRRGGFF